VTLQADRVKCVVDACTQRRVWPVLGDLPGSSQARRFIGAEHGGVPISLFLVDDRPGAGPRLHRHPYAELFIVHAGQAHFEIDDTRLTAMAGDILIAPAETTGEWRQGFSRPGSRTGPRAIRRAG
jgi:quercetin dioxygenase-like cupin family protein